MFKKIVLSCIIVILSVVLLALPCFAADYNYIIPNMTTWSILNTGSQADFTISWTTVSGVLANRISISSSQRDRVGVAYSSTGSPDINAQYKFSFNCYGNFNNAHMHVYVCFSDDIYDLNNYVELFVANTVISSTNPSYYTVQFVPSSYVNQLNHFYIVITFDVQVNASVTLIIRDLFLSKMNTIDQGNWTGPTIDIDSIDITDYIGDMSDSGGNLVNFLTTGFSSVRKGVIGVTSLFTLVWNYLSQHMPAIPYSIVFGLCLGLFGVVLSVFKYGKQSGSVSTYHEKSGGKKE